MDENFGVLSTIVAFFDKASGDCGYIDFYEGNGYEPKFYYREGDSNLKGKGIGQDEALAYLPQLLYGGNEVIGSIFSTFAHVGSIRLDNYLISFEEWAAVLGVCENTAEKYVGEAVAANVIIKHSGDYYTADNGKARRMPNGYDAPSAEERQERQMKAEGKENAKHWQRLRIVLLMHWLRIWTLQTNEFIKRI